MSRLFKIKLLKIQFSGTPIAVKYLEIKISLVLRSKTHAN